jgi:hypothetical protein
MENRKIIKAAKYVARIEGWEIVPPYAPGELPSVQIAFAIRDEHGEPASVRWRGSLKEGKARAITLKSLLVCGFRGTDLQSLVADPEALDRNRELEVETEIRTSKTGTAYTNVKWINRLGGGKYAGLSVQQAKAALGGLDLRGEFLAAADELGVALDAKKPVAATPTDFDDLAL